MATSQYNQGGYRPRPGGGRGRNNDPPRYRSPGQPQMVPPLSMLTPRSQVTAMNPTGATTGQRVLIPTNPTQLYYQQQQQQTLSTTSGTSYAVRAPLPLQQYPQGIMLANAQFPQLAYAAHTGYAVPPPSGAAINLQLNQHTPAVSMAALQVAQAAPVQPTTALVGSAPPFVPGQLVQPKPQPSTVKRERKVIRIIDPNTKEEVDLSSSKPVDPTPAPVPSTTQGGLLPVPTIAPAAPRPDVKKVFMSKVKSSMNPNPTEFVPMQPVNLESHRPNAIIRHPDEVKSESEAHVMNGVPKEDEPQTPLEPPPTDPIEEELQKTSEQAPVEAQTEEPSTQEPRKVPSPPIEAPKAPSPPIEPVDTTVVEPPKAEAEPAEVIATEEPVIEVKDSTQSESESVEAIVELTPTEPAVEPVAEEPETTPTETPPSAEVKGQPEPVEPESELEEGELEPEPEEKAAEPLVEDVGPKKYERSFLLSFAKTKACLEPPAGLVKVTDVFQKGGGQSLIRSGPPQGYQFQQGGYDRKGKGGMRRPSEPKKIIHQPLQTEKVELHKAEERWQRPQEVATKLTEEEKDTIELYRKFQGILNKLTPQKFQKLAEQALKLEINSKERLKGCIDKIFTKALEEPSFSIAYANLCKVLSPLKVDSDDEGKTKQTNFRRELLTKCQVEFERDKKDDEEREAMTKAVEEAATPEDKKRLQDELEDFETKARKRSLGNIRFIGELFKLGMLSETIMHECIVRLLRSTSDEESLECFARLITTTGKELDLQKAKSMYKSVAEKCYSAFVQQRIDGYFGRIQDIIKKGKIPSRIKFMLQDVQELRKNAWIPRQSQASTLKTIDQIHAEAKLAEEEDKRLASMSYQKGRGSLDDRRRGSSKEEWSTKGEKERAPKERPKMDANRLAALKKDKKDTPAVLGPPSLGPRRPGGAWARPTPSTTANTTQDKDKKPSRSSSSGSKRSDKTPSGRGSGSGPRRGSSHSSEQAAAVEAVLKLTNSGKPGRSASLPVKAPPAVVPDALDEDTVRRKTGTIVDELTDNGDIKEAVECVEEMKSPGLYNVLVSESITHSLEKKVAVRQAAGKLLEKLATDGILLEAKFIAGLNEVLEFADDLAMDIPKLWVYLAEILCPVFCHSTLPLSCLCGVPQPLIESGKAAVMVAEILVQCRRSLNSDDEVQTLWEVANMDWTKLGVNSEDLAEFLTKQSLEFLLPRSSATPQVPPYYQEMATLIANNDNTVNDIFDWVEKSVSVTDCKSSEFIFALATAIVEATVSGSGLTAIYGEEMFMKRATVLQKYVDEDTSLQVQILYALQVAVTKLEHPPKMLCQMFNELYDKELITEAAFRLWKDQGTENYGKGNCVQATKSFFEWLDSASVESDEEAGET